MWDSFLIFFGLLLVLLVAVAELRRQKLKTKTIPRLKKAIKKAENEALNKDIDKLTNADIDLTIGFLNRLRKDNRNSD